jgi:hypothetical protein
MNTIKMQEVLGTMGKDGATAHEAAALVGLESYNATKALSQLFLRGRIARASIGRGTGKSTHEQFRYYTKAAYKEIRAQAKATAQAATEAAKLNGGAVQAAIAAANKPDVPPPIVVPKRKAKAERLSPEGRKRLVAAVRAAWARRKAAQAAAAAPVIRAGKKRIPRKPFQVGKIGAVPWTIDTPYFTITITPKEGV